MAVRCGSCGNELGEAESTPVEERAPCPNCESTTRRYETTLEAEITAYRPIVAQPPTIQARGTVQSPNVQVSAAFEDGEALPIDPIPGVSTDTLDRPVQAVRDRHPDHVRTFCITNLADGTFVAEVLDEKGEVLSQGLGDDEEDTILELAEALK